MKKISVMLRLAPLLVAGAVALGSASAIAADTATGPGPIPSDGKGSITVHKHYGNPTANKGNGKVASLTADNPPLSGVKFKLQKAKNFNLTTNAGWTAAQAFLTNDPANNQTTAGFEDLAAGAEQATIADGTAKFENLPIGLYKVEETDVSGAKKGSDSVNVKKAAPFYVTIPMTDPENRANWMYSIHVYPKNQAFTVKKESKLIAGNKMRYTVTATLPQLAEGKKYEKYNLVDIMSANHNVSTFTLESIKARVDKDDNSQIDLTSYVDVDKTTAAAQYKVYVRFKKPTGLAELDKATGRATAGNVSPIKKEIVYTYTVNLADSFKEGSLTNNAYVAPSNDYDETNITGDTPGGTDTKKFVQLRIIKQDGVDNSIKLAGAKFELYACNASGKFINDAGTEVATKADALKLTGTTPIETADGTSGTTKGYTAAVRIPATDNGTSTIKKICAVETEAPSGYSLLNEPETFEAAYQANTATTPIDKTINNVRANAGWELPMTGAQGLVLFSVAGVLLIMGSILLVLTNRRKKADK